MSKYMRQPAGRFRLLIACMEWSVSWVHIRAWYTMKTTTTIKHRARLRSLHSICPFLCIYGLFIWRNEGEKKKSYFSILFFTLRTHTRLHWSETFCFLLLFFALFSLSFSVKYLKYICALPLAMQAIVAGFAKSHSRTFNSKKKNHQADHTSTSTLIVYARNVRIRSARMPGSLAYFIELFHFIELKNTNTVECASRHRETAKNVINFKRTKEAKKKYFDVRHETAINRTEEEEKMYSTTSIYT